MFMNIIFQCSNMNVYKVETYNIYVWCIKSQQFMMAHSYNNNNILR